MYVANNSVVFIFPATFKSPLNIPLPVTIKKSLTVTPVLILSP